MDKRGSKVCKKIDNFRELSQAMTSRHLLSLFAKFRKFKVVLNFENRTYHQTSKLKRWREVTALDYEKVFCGTFVAFMVQKNTFW